LNDEEFRRARDRVLARGEPNPRPARPEPGQIQQSPLPPVAEMPMRGRPRALSPAEAKGQLDSLNRQRALIELDKEWDREREKLIGQGRPPSRLGTIVAHTLVFLLSICVILPGIALIDDNWDRGIFLLKVAVPFFVVSVASAALSYWRALIYEEARARYDKR